MRIAAFVLHQVSVQTVLSVRLVPASIRRSANLLVAVPKLACHTGTHQVNLLNSNVSKLDGGGAEAKNVSMHLTNTYLVAVPNVTYVLVLVLVIVYVLY